MLTILTTTAFAMGAAPEGQAAQSGTAAMMNFVPLILMFAIFYFLLIRQQQKKAKEHRQMIEALKVGDNVKTAGGMHGKIVAQDDQIITLEIATGVKIKIDKPFVTTVVK